MVTVLVTGAFGNLGAATVEALLADGRRVRALRFRSEGGAVARRWRGRVEVVDGDVRAPATLAAAVRGVDVVVHLAYVIPPACLARPDQARRTNVDGTRNLVVAMQAEAPSARLLFASSLDVFGHTQHLPPPRRADDPVAATDDYTAQKLECEAMVRKSGLGWSILRYADVPPIALRSPVPIMFEIPLSQRIEAIHPLDAGVATARAATSDAAWGRVWLVGGGASCQLTYGDYLARFMAAMELGPPLPPAAFSTAPYCTDWLDTSDSQRAFQYQQRSFDDIVADVAALLGWRRPLAKLARPLVRRYMLSLSPYWARAR
ncbi:MAG TPA: NAD(P)-dependent oxidoreductase [Polyangia bacterium]